MRHLPAESSVLLLLLLCREGKNAKDEMQRECDMPRLSKLTIVQIAKRIALAVVGLADGPAPVLIPIPVQVSRETRLTRRIR